MPATLVLTEVPVVTREYYRVPWTVTVNGAPVDPTPLALECALVITDTPPTDADWKPGSWEVVSGDVPTYLARAFVGDAVADFTLDRASTYDVWMRITDSPERPARLVGRIKGV